MGRTAAPAHTKHRACFPPYLIYFVICNMSFCCSLQDKSVQMTQIFAAGSMLLLPYKHSKNHFCFIFLCTSFYLQCIENSHFCYESEILRFLHTPINYVPNPSGGMTKAVFYASQGIHGGRSRLLTTTD